MPESCRIERLFVYGQWNSIAFVLSNSKGQIPAWEVDSCSAGQEISRPFVETVHYYVRTICREPDEFVPHPHTVFLQYPLKHETAYLTIP